MKSSGKTGSPPNVLNEGTNDHLENGQHNERDAEEYGRVESLEFWSIVGVAFQVNYSLQNEKPRPFEAGVFHATKRP